MIREFGPDDSLMAEFRSLAPPIYRNETVSPAATCLLGTVSGNPAARCSLEHVREPDSPPTSILGHYEAWYADAGEELLRDACRRAVEAGSSRVIGPMNGSTWSRYRLMLGSPPERGEPEVIPFSTEPLNQPDYPSHFTNAGFEPAAYYESRIVCALPVERHRAAQLAERVRNSGITIASSQADRFEGEIEELYHFCTQVFSGNAFYRQIPFEAFRQGYAAMRPLLDLRLVLLARDRERKLVGFCFAFPDRHDPDDAGRRLVLKTLASAPEMGALGIGAHLADVLHQRAAKLGYTAVVHALMHVENDSVRLSHRFGSRLFRRYALYQWTP